MLLLTGCGLKTGLVVYDDSAPMPELSHLNYQLTKENITLSLTIQGGSGAVLYQIDRAVIEQDCKCVGNWLRYYESSPTTTGQLLQRSMKLHPELFYAFRVRVMDSLGRKSGWSRTIRTDAPPVETKNTEHEKTNE